MVRKDKKQEPKEMSGKFKVMDRDPDCDILLKLRGEKHKVIFALAGDLKQLPSTKTICLGTDEEFHKSWGPFKTQKGYILSQLKRFDVPNAVMAQHKGNVLIWTR